MRREARQHSNDESDLIDGIDSHGKLGEESRIISVSILSNASSMLYGFKGGC